MFHFLGSTASTASTAPSGSSGVQFNLHGGALGMSQQAKIVRLRQFGGPEVLQLETVQLPPVGADEVLLEVQFIGLNRAEVLYRQGTYLVKPELPAPIGMECAGIISE